MQGVIDFYLDFTSPYAYLASTQIEALAAHHGRETVWHPFLIGATFSLTGRKALIEHPLVWDYTVRDVQRSARLLAQPLKIPVKFPILSVKAARLFYYLQDQEGGSDAAKGFASAVFRAYFVGQEDITDTRVLCRIAAPFDVTAQRLEELVQSSEMKRRFRTEVDAAIDRGVFGAPIFIVDDEMFWGLDHLEQLDRWLRTGGW